MDHKDFAIRMAKQAGEILKRDFSFGLKKEWKKDESVVTQTDIEINKMIIAEVKKNFPNYGVLSEEASHLHKKDSLWVCDPIDGTIPFAHGIPTFTFSLALVQKGQPKLGVIYDPFMDRLYYGEKGKGAFLNDKKIEVSKDSNIYRKLIEVESWQQAPYQLPGFVQKIEKDGAIFIDLCSFAYCGALIASGEMIGGVCSGAQAHDIAAAKIIVEEAGGKVTDLYGQEQRFDKEDIKGSIISNGSVHDYLIEQASDLIVTKKSTKL